MVRDTQSGKYRRTRLFVLTLGFSRKCVRLLCFHSSARIWAELHEQAFRRLGGATKVVVLDNLTTGIADLIFGGVCHRFPDLKLVSVESGVGWIPAAMETFDWQWRNGGVLDEHPEYPHHIEP